MCIFFSLPPPQISSVVSQLPKADVYVLEKKVLSTKNINMFPVILHLRTIEAMLYTLLHKTLMLDVQNQIISMPRTAVGKHFGLMVGDFRSSGMDLVKQLLESATQEQPRISFPLNKVESYRSLLSSVAQNREEEMCDSLLQALAFYELLIWNNITWISYCCRVKVNWMLYFNWTFISSYFTYS